MAFWSTFTQPPPKPVEFAHGQNLHHALTFDGNDTGSLTSGINEEENGESPILDIEPQSQKEAEVQAQEVETTPTSQRHDGGNGGSSSSGSDGGGSSSGSGGGGGSSGSDSGGGGMMVVVVVVVVMMAVVVA
ncbi:keratin, type I cytoskeletal 10-like [Camellia sinensis]|uniref:keratin, type I cytoskeletal 10-like n=1 Tax=Camellia sinensis TaxID=4442 RepID=UPI001036D22C|nr:keratin, type I cytoskeletal 10-like [Camellia sinensis]